MIEVAVTELGRHERTFAAGVLGRGFRDNPGTIAVFGDDPSAGCAAWNGCFGHIQP